MTDDYKRVLVVAGVIVGLPVAAFLGYLVLVYAGYLATLAVIVVTLGAIGGLALLGSKVYWAYKGPRVIYEKDTQQARALVDRHGGVTFLPHAPYPPNLHTLNFHQALQSYPELELPAPVVVDEEPASLPTVHFRDIAPQIGPGQMLIGVRADGSLRLGTWDDHKTILVLGKSSSGKTTTIAEKAGEAVKSGACLVVCDPHAHKADSLARKLEPLASFLLPGTGIVSRHEDVLSCIHLVADELEQRVRGAVCEPAIVLIVEEVNRLMRDERLAEDIATITQQIGQEGRGFGIYAVFGAQDMIGPTFAKLRRSFISYILHRTDEAQARLLVPARYAKLAPELPAGQTYVVDDDGVTEPLRQALITRGDLEELARRVPARRQSQPGEAGWRAPALGMIARPAGYSEAEALRIARAAREEMERQALEESMCVEAPETENLPSDPKISVLRPTHTLTHKASRVTPEQRAYILGHREDMSASAIAIMLWNDAHKNVIVRQVWQEEEARLAAHESDA